jgi:hypothetical protein
MGIIGGQKTEREGGLSSETVTGYGLLGQQTQEKAGLRVLTRGKKNESPHSTEGRLCPLSTFSFLTGPKQAGLQLQESSLAPDHLGLALFNRLGLCSPYRVEFRGPTSRNNVISQSKAQRPQVLAPDSPATQSCFPSKRHGISPNLASFTCNKG